MWSHEKLETWSICVSNVNTAEGARVEGQQQDQDQWEPWVIDRLLPSTNESTSVDHDHIDDAQEFVARTTPYIRVTTGIAARGR